MGAVPLVRAHLYATFGGLHVLAFVALFVLMQGLSVTTNTKLLFDKPTHRFIPRT